MSSRLLYHGTDAIVVDSLVAGTTIPTPSMGPFDWLGQGVYFYEEAESAWSHAGEVARRWANKEKLPKSRSPIVSPAVVGAVVSREQCLDLTTPAGMQTIKTFVPLFEEAIRVAKAERGIERPQNRHETHVVLTGLTGQRILIPRPPDNKPSYRQLDFNLVNFVCAELEEVHNWPVWSVRCAFQNGSRITPGSEIYEHNKIQVCVRNVEKAVERFFAVPEVTQP